MSLVEGHTLELHVLMVAIHDDIQKSDQQDQHDARKDGSTAAACKCRLGMDLSLMLVTTPACQTLTTAVH